MKTAGLLFLSFALAGAPPSFAQDAAPSPATAAPADTLRRTAFSEYPAALSRSLSLDRLLTAAAHHAAACAALDTAHRQPQGTFAKELPRLAAFLLAEKEPEGLDRARALLVQQKFADAEIAAIAVKKAARPADPGFTGRSLTALETAGLAALGQSINVRALQHFEEAAALTSPDPDFDAWGRLHQDVAYVLIHLGRPKEAETLLRKVLEKYSRTLGPENPQTLQCHLNMAASLRSQGRFAEVEANQRTVLAARQRVLGPEHPDTLQSHINLSSALFSQEKHPEAEAELRVALAIQERLSGPDHPDSLAVRSTLGTILLTEKNYPAAEQEFLRVTAARLRLPGAEHPLTLDARYNLATARYGLGRHADATAEFLDVFAIRLRIQGSDHPDVQDERRNLLFVLNAAAELAAKNGDSAAARDLWQQTLSLTRDFLTAAEKTLPKADPSLQPYRDNLRILEEKVGQSPKPK